MCLCVLWPVPMQLVCSAVINDSRGERTSAVSPFWLFWADLVWEGHSGHKASGNLKILGHSLTCTSASALQEYFHVLREGSTVSTQGHTFNQQERTLTVCLHSFPLYAENRFVKSQHGSLRDQKHSNNQTCINILPCHRFTDLFDALCFKDSSSKLRNTYNISKNWLYDYLILEVHSYIKQICLFYLYVKLSLET